jgi:hypothetical protein
LNIKINALFSIILLTLKNINMKTIFFIAIMAVVSFSTKAQTLTLNNNTNCEVMVRIFCYEAANCTSTLGTTNILLGGPTFGSTILIPWTGTPGANDFYKIEVCWHIYPNVDPCEGAYPTRCILLDGHNVPANPFFLSNSCGYPPYNYLYQDDIIACPACTPSTATVNFNTSTLVLNIN